MTRGEQNLRAAVAEFALTYGLTHQALWTGTGLQVEFVEPLECGKDRRFMRCTVAHQDVDRCNGLMKDTLKARWKAAWTKVLAA